MVERLAGTEVFSCWLPDDKDLSEQVMSVYLPLVYGRAKVAWQEHCPMVSCSVRRQRRAHT